MTDAVFRALRFAVDAHAGQYRKGTRVPYIVHPLGAAQSLIEIGASEPVVVAALLHDVVEDTPVTLDDVEREFGAEVARLVRGASEPDKSWPWERRKQHTIDHLRDAPEDEMLVGLADKLDNLRSIRRDGEAAWAKFNRGREKQKWYYESIAAALASREVPPAARPLAAAFAALVREVFTPASPPA